MLFGGLNFLMVYALISQVFMGITFGDNPMSNSGLIISTILMAAFSAFFFSIRLQLDVFGNGLTVSFFPFVKLRFIAYSDIEEAAIRQYKPLIEYGGWGLRGNFKGLAYTISGNHGLQLGLKGGQQLLIGTQKPNQLARALQSTLLSKN